MDVQIILNQLEIVEAAEELANTPNRDFWSKWNKEADPFENLTDAQFIKLFRLTKELVIELTNDLNNLLIEPARLSCVPKRLKVLIALNFFGSGSYQSNVGFNKYLGVSQSTVSRVIREVAEALNNPRIFGKWVKFSMQLEKLSNMRNRFYNAYGIPGIVGVIDCTHIAIFPPTGNEHAYVNRKQYHSINTQLVCDIDLKILNVNAKYPGSTHDAHIWNNSNLKTVFENAVQANDFMYFLIGDSGYPLRRWLQIPFSNPEHASPEEAYNVEFLKARSLIERCNGLLKMRFRCLLKHRVLHYSPAMAAQIINACVVLHNICIENRLPDPEDEEEEEENIDFGMYGGLHFEQDVAARNHELEAGRRLREQIVQNYF